jgi:hypothetical protein
MNMNLFLSPLMTAPAQIAPTDFEYRATDDGELRATDDGEIRTTDPE